MSKEEQEKFGQDLKNISVRLLIEKLANFLDVPFIYFFGKRQFSWQCFWGTLKFSFATILIAHLLYVSFTGWLPGHFILFAINFIANYLLFSGPVEFIIIWKTRLLIRQIESDTKTNVLGLLVLDMIITFILATAKYALIAISSHQDFRKIVENFLYNVVMIQKPELDSPGIVYGLFFYATFFSSFFLWLYFLSGVLVRIGSVLANSYVNIAKRFDFKKKPFQVIDVVYAIIITLVLIIAYLFNKFDSLCLTIWRENAAQRPKALGFSCPADR